jgi:hypothetical protein
MAFWQTCLSPFPTLLQASTYFIGGMVLSHNPYSTSGTSPTQKKKTAIPQAHFRIEFHTSIYLIVPLCASAREWLDEHLGKDNGFQPYWPTAIVEPRYLAQIIAGIRRDGLVAR